MPVPKSKRQLKPSKKKTERSAEVDEQFYSPLIDPLDRLKELLIFIVSLLLGAFQNITILLFAAVLVILGLLYLFFSLFGLT